MRSFLAILKKENLECVRSGKLTILCILFLLFGIMNPAIAKMIPWLLKIMSDSLAETGMTVTDTTIDALTSWTQFFKNIPMALIVFVLVYSGTFTKEYESGTLILLLTKGLSRYKVVLAKFVVMLAVWTIGYWICFAITYGYNAYFWDNSIAVWLMSAAIHWWLFGVWVVCLIVLFSTLCSSYTGVLLGTGGSVIGVYLISLFPQIGKYTPAALMNSASLLIGTETADAYELAFLITVLASVSCLIISVVIIKKKRL